MSNRNCTNVSPDLFEMSKNNYHFLKDKAFSDNISSKVVDSVNKKALRL